MRSSYMERRCVHRLGPPWTVILLPCSLRAPPTGHGVGRWSRPTPRGVSAGTTPFGGVTEPLTIGPGQGVTGVAAERAGDGHVHAVTGVLGQPHPDLFVTGPEHVERVRHGGPATVGVGPP